MRTLRWVPLTFLAGLDGFAMLVPYIALVAGLWIYLQVRKQNALA